jgi:hypothetical protein
MSASNGHDEPPRGTAVIVAAFAGLVVTGWLLLYFGLFMPRMAP